MAEGTLHVGDTYAVEFIIGQKLEKAVANRYYANLRWNPATDPGWLNAQKVVADRPEIFDKALRLYRQRFEAPARQRRG